MDLEPYMQYVQYAVPAAIVLAVLLILAVLIRMIGRKVSGRRGNRLGVSEYYEIDKSRRLVLVRRDEVEHLLMIGGGEDIVVEQGIGAGELPSVARHRKDGPSLDRPKSADIEPLTLPEDNRSPTVPPRAPKPAVFGDRAPNLRPVEDKPEPSLDKAKG